MPKNPQHPRSLIPASCQVMRRLVDKIEKTDPSERDELLRLSALMSWELSRVVNIQQEKK